MKKSLSLLSAILLVSGCAFTPHDVNTTLLQPEVTDATIGEGTALRLRVLDERDNTALGNRGAGVSMAEVSSTNVMDEFTRVVRQGFESKGYALVDNAADADASADVALRSLKFDETSGFWTVGANVNVAILVEAERGANDYKNDYRISDEERQFAISTGDGIDDSINAALNAAIDKLFKDEALDSFLTTEEAGSGAPQS